MNIYLFLSKKISQAFFDAGIGADHRIKIHQSKKSQFGDYQVNGVIDAAKKLAIPSRQLAEKVLTKLDLTGIADKVEIAGPGFINIFLASSFLERNVDLSLKNNLINKIKQIKPQIIVVDYSSPNLAKEMHVGHLRSTIIGDAMVRTLELIGHTVIRANHVGDWGTQFGMLIAYLEKKQQKKTIQILIKDLEKFYCEAKKYYDEDITFAKIARSYVVKLQKGDEYSLRIWRKIIDVTIFHNQINYNRLNVTLTYKDIIGESFYNQFLPDVVTDLKKRGLAIDSEGATIVVLNELKNKEGKIMGVIIQKKDGGYLYTTIDIACAKYRYEVLHADRILYYTDSRQRQHLMQALAIVRKAGYVPDSVSMEHHVFGMMLDKAGKPFKTRTGDTIKLSNLLDEALERARKLVLKKNPNISVEELEKLSNIIGIGAVKYADLSKNRTTDYIFNWDDILKFEGNTAPYIQYAYTRICSLIRKANIDENIFSNIKIIISKNYEKKLAIRLLQFHETLDVVACNGTPHVMCSYLYDLASQFSVFYENCPILSSKLSVCNSRLKLSLLTAKTLKLGLSTLGIETVERM